MTSSSDPTGADADSDWRPHHDRAVALKSGPEAEAEARAAADAAPDNAACQFVLGWVMQNGGKLSEARAAYQAAINLDPADARPRNNLGNVLRGLGDYDAALDAANETLRLKPNHGGAWLTRGDACKALGRVEDALVAYKTGHIQAPDDLELAYGLADLLLATGDYANGWRAYEARWALNRMGGELTRRRAEAEAVGALWDGTPLPDATVLVMAEQGLGDTLQFCRFVPALKEVFRTVCVEVQAPLVPLLASGLDGVDRLTVRGETPPVHDRLVPMMSVPGHLGITLATLPAKVPYIKAPSGHVVKWAALGRDLQGKTVGLVWAGSADHAGDHHRSLALSDLAPVLDVPGVSFVSLQVGPGRDQIGTVGRRVMDAGHLFESFADTAGAMLNLDLVITVDTATAHLAGALGKPVWTLVPAAPDWRWLFDRDDSPWYPSMRLYRQEPRDDGWGAAVARIAADLAAFVDGGDA